MELKTEVVKMSLFRTLWILIGLSLFVIGIANHDWIFLIAGMFMMLERITIVHYGDVKYEND